MLESIWDGFKAKFPPNRAFGVVMTLLTPLLALASAYLSALVARHLPGVHLTAAEIFGAFVTGAGLVLAPAITFLYKWFSGWIQRDAHKQALERILVDEQGVQPAEAKAQVEEAHP